MTDDKLSVEDLESILINPFYAITIHPGLFGEHAPIISKQEWVKVQKRLLEKEMTIDQWLARLLDILEGNYIMNENGIDGYISSETLSEEG